MDASRKLYRSTGNRQLAGVYGGLAEYFNLDPTPLLADTEEVTGSNPVAPNPA